MEAGFSDRAITTSPDERGRRLWGAFRFDHEVVWLLRRGGGSTSAPPRHTGVRLGAAAEFPARQGSMRSSAAPSHVVCVHATPRPFFGRSTS